MTTTGFVKQKEYKIADSNIALLGSDLEKKVKLASAETEAAWTGAGKNVGIQIWRIEKFKVVAVPKDKYGQFYNGDSYILLHTYKKKDETGSDKIYWDIHFWLGTNTTQDEAGTAAYKTVELDTLLGGAPVQHREVEEKESELFLSYFTKCGGIRILEGGIDSGFNHVKPKEYKPRLLHLKGRKYVRIVEVPLSYKSLNSGDVFILDAGLQIYIWQGAKSGLAEKSRATTLAQALDDERGGKPTRTVFAEGDKDAKDFWTAIGGEGTVASAESAGLDQDWEKVKDKKLFKLTDEKGTPEFKLIKEGKVAKSDLKSDDAFIFDTGNHIWVWIGKDASPKEKAQALKYAQDHATACKRPAWLPISRVLQTGEPESFWASFDS